MQTPRRQTTCIFTLPLTPSLYPHSSLFFLSPYTQSVGRVLSRRAWCASSRGSSSPFGPLRWPPPPLIGWPQAMMTPKGPRPPGQNHDHSHRWGCWGSPQRCGPQETPPDREKEEQDTGRQRMGRELENSILKCLRKVLRIPWLFPTMLH